MKPWAFKVRGGGNATGIKGGPIKAGIQGGVGALYSQDRVFTIATHPDQWIATPPLTDNQYTYHNNPMSTPVVPLRYVSVCSGMEAASVAWHPLGFKPVAFSEIEPFPCAILKHRFPNTPNYGSLTEYQSWPLEPGAIDLLVGGCPCQSFSVAGLRRGMQDPRGNLTLTYLGLVDKLKPRWVVYENVPGLLSSNGGRDFGSFVGALGQLGYGWAMRILDAQHFGVPQRRRRVFVVACLGDWRAPAEVLSLREGLRGYLETGNKKRKSPSADAGAGVEASGPIGVDFRHERFERDGTVGTIQSKSTGGYSLNYAPGVAIPYRKSKRDCSTTDNETWVPADASNTLNNFDLGDTRTTHAVVQPHIATPMAVRRLTPVECERLQGFPDNWSRISWKGKPEDECPDGPRYKACGNSMAVPCMFWIGSRIAAVNATLSQNHETK
jgi:DNA (cytosine-5)-methyltransferase 1